MAQYFCGNPICKKTIVSESVDWPLRCEHCNQQCYPEDFQPASSAAGGSSIHTQDDGFRLPGAILMIRGPAGTLVPFRSSTRPAAHAEPSQDASLDRLLALVDAGESTPEPERPRETPGNRRPRSRRPDTPAPSRAAGTTPLFAGSPVTRRRALAFGGVALVLAAIVLLVSRWRSVPEGTPAPPSSGAPAAAATSAATTGAETPTATAPPATSATATRAPGAAATTSPYSEARRKFQTHLLRKGAAPQEYSALPPPPSGVREVKYRSGALQLKAWVSAPPAGGQRRAAVLFLHGGFAFSVADWEMTKPYRDADFVVLVPMLRGENGLPGNYSMFFDELDDVDAAAEVLGALPYVRSDHLYVAGHSVGGTLAILTAMRSSRFRAAASFAGSPDQTRWSALQPEVVPFDPSDAAELHIRSPIEYATSFRCPTRLYHGGSERFFAASTAMLAERAQAGGLDVRAIPVPGDHMSHVAEAMQRSIEFFREH